MRKLILAGYAILILASCSKANTEEQATAPPAQIDTTNDDLVWVGDQGNGQIEIYDPKVADWNNPSALKWSWKPTAANGYTPYALQHWDVPNDFKVRNISAWGGDYLVASASGGLVTIASYPAGVKRWAYNVGNSVHPHAAELLPTGDVAVACTDQDSVKVFMSSSSKTDNIVHASFYLESAHAIVWDPTTSTIRAIGKDKIVSLTLGGTQAAPTLTENVAARGDIAAGGAGIWGHDLSPDLNDNNIIWCTTNTGVFSFNKTTRTFTGAPGGGLGVNKTFVKGISRQKSGIFVMTRQDSSKSPLPPDAVTTPTWCTRYVDFYDAATGAFKYSRTRSGFKLYKGKIFRTAW